MNVFVDLETTGFNQKLDHIIRISAIRARGYAVDDIFDHLVNPGHSLTVDIQSLTGIDPAKLALAPSLDQLRGLFKKFCLGCTLISWGDFEHRWLQQYGLAAKCFSAISPFKDSVKNGMDVYADFKLVTVARKLGLSHQPHDSLSDSLVLYNIINLKGLFR